VFVVSAEIVAVLAVGAALPGLILQGQRGLRANFNERMDRTDKRLDTIDARLDRMDGRIERIEERLDRMGRRMGRIDERLAALGERVPRIKGIPHLHLGHNETPAE